MPSQWAYSNVEDGGIWEDGDIRKEESIRYDFTYYGQTPTLDNILWEELGDDHDELLPHIKKYEDFRTDSHSGLGINNEWNSGKNIPFLRLANAILLYAECLNELGQTGEAVKQVNIVRKRAWEDSLPADKAWSEGMSQDEFRKEIMTERVRELFGERWRKFDLIRTGHFLDYVSERNKWLSFGNNPGLQRSVADTSDRDQPERGHDHGRPERRLQINNTAGCGLGHRLQPRSL